MSQQCNFSSFISFSVSLLTNWHLLLDLSVISNFLVPISKTKLTSYPVITIYTLFLSLALFFCVSQTNQKKKRSFFIHEKGKFSGKVSSINAQIIPSFLFHFFFTPHQFFTCKQTLDPQLVSASGQSKSMPLIRSIIQGMRSRSRRVVQDGPMEVVIDGLKQSCWANMPQELLREVLMRIEASENSWPPRKSVVACAGVCRSWREITKEIVKTPEVSTKITFPISVKQVRVQCSR